MIRRFGCNNWNSKTWNKKKQEGKYLGALLAPSPASLVQPVIYSVVKDIHGRGFRRTARGYMKYSQYI